MKRRKIWVCFISSFLYPLQILANRFLIFLSSVISISWAFSLYTCTSMYLAAVSNSGVFTHNGCGYTCLSKSRIKVENGGPLHHKWWQKVIKRWHCPYQESTDCSLPESKVFIKAWKKNSKWACVSAIIRSDGTRFLPSILLLTMPINFQLKHILLSIRQRFLY